ncbi:hypothetical protein CEXT_378481 [Caerostris extrusa]|uniref:Uncharacterized protein n=1 Tax=Caerostris extrusa TaxID=172846 RepID=A0AAV4S387_CAEEX|nr:hypothetical protein CEXT_378481 [Caerostris extrusa]
MREWQGFKHTLSLLIKTTCENGFYGKSSKLTYLQALDLCEINIVYAFVLGDQGTAKTTLMDSLTTRRIADPLLPSVQYVSESIPDGSDMSMITLRLLELKRVHLYFSEITQICILDKSMKHI